MTALRDDVDPDGLLEYSVVYTDRSLNHMSVRFGEVLRDIHATLCEVYAARRAVVVPGSGTFAMEAVVRQFARGRRCLVVRNGWFSYRWSQILDKGLLDSGTRVLNAGPVGSRGAGPVGSQGAAPVGSAGSGPAQYAPPSIESVRAAILEHRPEVVFAPHVETSAGLHLPDAYVAELASAAHEVGALLVLDCVASGTHWVSLEASGVDVLVTAPQKGWSASPCAGLVMLGERGVEVLAETQSDSFALDLRKWSDIMGAFLAGGHAYHATMPTDSLVVFRDTMEEMRGMGFDVLKARQDELGRRVRAALVSRGFVPVAAEPYHASGVVVVHTDDDALHKGAAFAAAGLQIAAGVPLQIGEPDTWKTFRIGLFGIDKLADVDGAVARFERALDEVTSAREVAVAEPEPA